jgi:hemerythrin-like domain-containing protein
MTAPSVPPSFNILNPAPGTDDPIGMLHACHRRLEGRLDTLARIVEVFRDREEDRYDQAAGAAGMAIRYFCGAAHHHKCDEEESLFPRMIEADASVSALLDALEADHLALENRWASMFPTLEKIAEGLTPTDAELLELAEDLAFLDAGYRKHIQQEDQTIFPTAVRLLAPDELLTVGREMAARRFLV